MLLSVVFVRIIVSFCDTVLCECFLFLFNQILFVFDDVFSSQNSLSCAAVINKEFVAI